MVLVDTNVILDIATNDPRWFEWSHAQLEPLIDAGGQQVKTRDLQS